MKIILTPIMVILLLVAGIAIAQADDTVSGSFMGSVELTVPENPDKDGQGPSMLSGQTINLEGSLYWDSPNLRIEFTQDFTMEEMVVLINYDTQMATVLFPDTLNGFEVDMQNLPGGVHFDRLRDVISSKGTSVPKGWKSSGEPETDQATKQTKNNMKGPGGELLSVFTDIKGIPVAMEVTTDKWILGLDLFDISYGKEQDSKLFTYDKDSYSITPFTKNEHSMEIQL